MHHRGVEEMKLRAVGEHEPDRVAATHAQRVKSAGQATDARRIFRVADRDAVADRPERDLLRPLGGRALERLTHRLSLQRRRALRRIRPGLYRALHLPQKV